MCPIFLFPPLGVTDKLSLPGRLSAELQASRGLCVVVGGSAEATRANAAVYFHSVMCVNLITGR